MVNDSIQRSRRGIAYQDRYALLKFLEYFQEGRLKEFYTDYSFDEKGHSLDVFVVLRNPMEEHIFEIKTGEKFKTDKTQELAKELHTLYEFSHKSGKVSKVFLVVDPEIHVEILWNWGVLHFIKEKRGGKLGTETYNEVVERYQGNFGFNGIDRKGFVSFIRNTEFEQGLPNKKEENEKISYLENVIMGKIRNICEKVESNGVEVEIPYYTTMEELLAVVRYGAEYGPNIVLNIIEVLTGSFARRWFVEKRIDIPSGVSRHDEIRKQEAIIRKKLMDEYQPTVIDVKDKDFMLQSINQIIQSGQYSKNREVILDFFKDEELKFYFLNKLPDSLEDLAEIEFILEELVKDERSFKLISILKESISERNIEFVINFINKHYEELGRSFE